MRKKKKTANRKAVFVLLTVCLTLSAGFWAAGELAQPPVAFSCADCVELSPPAPTPTPTPTLKEKIAKYVCSKDWPCADALRVVAAESGFDPEAVNVNRDLSLDRGLWQINSRFHPQVSNSCAFDIECSTDAAYEIFIGRGRSFSAWVAARKLNIK